MITIAVDATIRAIIDEPESHEVLRQALFEHLPRQRWFAAKDQAIVDVRPAWYAEFGDADDAFLLTEIKVATADGGRHRYLLPLAVEWGEKQPAQRAPFAASTIAQVSRGLELGALYDATQSDRFVQALPAGMAACRPIPVGDSVLQFQAGKALEAMALGEDAAVRRLGAEQSNSSAIVGGQAMVKIYRRLEVGIQPEVEVGRLLSDKANFPHVPPWLGSLDRIDAEGRRTTYAAAFGFVANEGDGWRWTLDHLADVLGHLADDAGAPIPAAQSDRYGELAAILGRRTAELHRAFASDTDDQAFAREPVSPADLTSWLADVRTQVAAGFATLAQVRASASAAVMADIDRALALRPTVEAATTGIDDPIGELVKTRLHGDFHLGQILVVNGDVLILDFEGEPAKSLTERRTKISPLKDVAGMLRSFDYAAWASALHLAESHPDAHARILSAALAWRDTAQRAFLNSYRAVISGCPIWPAGSVAAERLLQVFMLQKLFYELQYEAANRPNWLTIPLRGIVGLLEVPER